jgi:hypothetical protein
MRKIITLALASAAVAGTVLTAGPALAGTGPGTTGTPGNSPIVKMTGSYAAAYTDPFFGPVSCNEVHHANVKAGQNFDSITCTSTTGSPLANVVPGQVGQVGWNTDFPISEPTGLLSFTVSADGLSYTGTASY